MRALLFFLQILLPVTALAGGYGGCQYLKATSEPPDYEKPQEVRSSMHLDKGRRYSWRNEERELPELHASLGFEAVR